ncbi:MAG: FAD-binding oxidoreductase [PVC group bacterium]
MFKEIETELIEVIERTDNVISFRFDDRGGVDFRPGQFFQLFLEWKGAKLDHYFSFSSSPTEQGYLEFTKKISDSDYCRALLALRPGDPVRMKLPLGRFIFDGQSPRAAFLSGGIGITPIRSICRYLTDVGSSSRALVLYSARTGRDFVFLDDFREMEERNPRLSVTLTVTDQEPPDGWTGRTGRISAAMVREEISDYFGWVFYVCGPPKMVEALVSMLRDELKLPPERVIIENFKGY